LQPISQGEEIMNEMPVTPTEEPKKSNMLLKEDKLQSFSNTSNTLEYFMRYWKNYIT
jgi:hypothetical protein